MAIGGATDDRVGRGIDEGKEAELGADISWCLMKET